MKQKISSLIVNLSTVFSAIFCLFILIFVSNKGISFSDESLHLLFTSVPNQDFDFTIMKYALLFKVLNLELPIYATRLLGVFGLGIATLYFWRTLVSMSLVKKEKGYFYYIFLIIATSCYFVGAIYSLSYNLIILICGLISSSLFIHLWRNPDKLRLHVIVSFVLYVIYITKLPTSVLFCFIYLLVLSLQVVLKKITFLKALGTLGLSLIIPCLFFFVFPKTSPLFMLDVLQNFGFPASYDPIKLLMNFIFELGYFITFISLGVFSRSLSQNIKRETFRTGFLLFSMILGFLYAKFIFNDELNSRPVWIPLFSVFSIGLLYKEFLQFNIEKRSFLVFLLVLPFIMILGTNNGMLISSVKYSPIWLVITSFLISQTKEKWYLNFIMFIFCLSLPYSLASTLVLNPYRQDGILANTEVIRFNNGDHYVTPEVKESIDDLSTILSNSGYSSDYILGLSRLCGEVLFSGKTYPCTPVWSKDFFKKDWVDNNKLPPNFFLLSSHNTIETKEILESFKSYNIVDIGKYNKKNSYTEGDVINCFYISK